MVLWKIIIFEQYAIILIHKRGTHVMKKAIKFIIPLLFSLCCLFVFCIAFFIKVSIFWGLLLLGGIIILILFIIPLYCAFYSLKLVTHESKKYLFAIYNSSVITLSYLLPFCMENETYVYSIILFVWASIWSLLPLLFHRSNKGLSHSTQNKNTRI